MSKRTAKKLRYLFSLLLVGIFLYFQERPIPSSNEPVQLFASAAHDDLRKTYLHAIEGANDSIYLVMYSLNDEQVIQALNKKAKEGVDIKVVHDTSTPQKGFKKLRSIKRIPMEMSGLMHQKILVVDQQRVWIGSANFTTESLRLHDNLVGSVISPELSQTIVEERPTRNFKIGGQLFEFWTLPRDNKEGLPRLLQLINTAEKTIRVAMFTWTHPKLTDAIIAAHNRGVSVEVILDHGQANGVGQKATQSLVNSGVAVYLSSGQKLLHHKCMIVDGKLLVNGSANWTKAAFSRNRDCFFILHDLTEEQRQKLDVMWKRTRIMSNKQHSITYEERELEAA